MWMKFVDYLIMQVYQDMKLRIRFSLYISVNFGDVSHEFNFSRFHRHPRDKELPIKDEIIGLASISVPPTDPLEQYLLDHENDLICMKEMK